MEETKCYCGHTTYCDCGDKELKQETLEEVAHKMLDDYGIKSMGQSIGVLEVKKLMVKITKWQQERSYSEEEVLKAQQAILCNIKDALMNENYIIEYIEQFKNK